MAIELVMLTNHLIFCHSLILLPSIFPSIKVCSNESALCIRWPKNWSQASAAVRTSPKQLTSWQEGEGAAGSETLLSTSFSPLLFPLLQNDLTSGKREETPFHGRDNNHAWLYSIHIFQQFNCIHLRSYINCGSVYTAMAFTFWLPFIILM